MGTNKYNKNTFFTELQSFSVNVFITSSSFEDRCFLIPELLSQVVLDRAIIFYNENEVKLISSNAEEIKNKIPNSDSIALNSDDPVSNYIKIDLAISELCNNITFPNILIDSTTFTHENLLILLKILELKKSLIGAVHFTYVGAKGYSTNTPKDEDKWLSKGIKEIRTVLGYPGYTDPIQKNHLIILFGFESERTKRIIEEYEFENITLGFADVDSSILQAHHKINLERHRKLMIDYPHAKEFTFSLTDPYQTKTQIINYLKAPQYRYLNTVIAPLNNKISTIGAGLAALENENIQIAYAKPNIYNTRGYSISDDNIYLFKVTF